MDCFFIVVEIDYKSYSIVVYKRSISIQYNRAAAENYSEEVHPISFALIVRNIFGVPVAALNKSFYTLEPVPSQI